MLLPINRLLDMPVMSLQTGTELARTTEPIIDPRQMVITAFFVEGRLLDAHPSILHVSDIRELSDIGMIVDDSDTLMSSEGLVRLQEVIDFNFNLVGLKVVDERGHKLGKVSDYVVEPETYSIQQIYTEQSLLRSLSTMSSVIHRSQIISVTNQQLTIASPTIKESSKETAKQAFVNPFRTDQQPEG